MTPEQLNQFADDRLFACIDAIIAVHSEAVTASTPLSQFSLAPYITFLLLHRARERIVHLRKSGQCALAIGKVWAWAIFALTGMQAPPDVRDVEKIGDRVDKYYDRQYIKALKRISNQTRDPMARMQRVTTLGLQCCHITPNAQVEVYLGPFVELPPNSSPMPTAPAPYVPYTQSRLPPDMTPIELRQQLNVHQQQMSDLEVEQRALFRDSHAEAAQRIRDAMKAAAAAKCEQQAAETSAEWERQRRKKEMMSRQKDIALADGLRREVFTLRGKVEFLGARIIEHAAEAAREKEAHDKLESQLRRVFEKKVRTQVKKRIRADVTTEYEERVAALEAKVQWYTDRKAAMAKRARAAEARAATSEKRLHDRKEAENELKIVRAELDATYEKLEQAETIASTAVIKAFEPRVRWLLRRTPPSAIGQNFVEAAKLLVPGTDVHVPSTEEIRRMRQEASLLTEAVAAYRIASSKRILSFGFDETTKMGDGLASTNFQIETAEGEVCDVVLRGAFLIQGGCADQVARAMESKLFARARRLLSKWRGIYEAKHGSGMWSGPKPSQLGYHQLAKSLIMSDTCSAARAAKRMIIDFAGAEVERLAREAGIWDSMSAQEREEAAEAFVGDCMQHIRNIILDPMAAAGVSMLKSELEESLDAFSSYERMSTDAMQLIRAVRSQPHTLGSRHLHIPYLHACAMCVKVYKEFHHEGMSAGVLAHVCGCLARREHRQGCLPWVTQPSRGMGY